MEIANRFSFNLRKANIEKDRKGIKTGAAINLAKKILRLICYIAINDQ